MALIVGSTILQRARSFRTADTVAILFAAALTAVFLNQPAPAAGQTFISLAVTLAFALLAFLAHGVNLSGAIAGAAIAFILAARDIRMFYVLLVVFGATFLATRLGLERKKQLRKAEAGGGRSASQVAANLGVAAVIAVLAPAQWKVLAMAALAEAAADTSSSEAGLAFPGRTVLITNWQPVPPGVDGAISVLGTAAAAVGAGLIALSGLLLGLISRPHAIVVLGTGFLGTVVDSLLGALAERRGYLSNDLVNLLSTAAAVGVAAWLLR